MMCVVSLFLLAAVGTVVMHWTWAPRHGTQPTLDPSMENRSGKVSSRSSRSTRVGSRRLTRWAACHTSAQGLHGVSSERENDCSAASAAVISVTLMRTRTLPWIIAQMTHTQPPMSAACLVERNMLSRLKRYNLHPTALVFPSLYDSNLNRCIVCLEKHGCSKLCRTGMLWIG